jgi:hypothetical protein
MACAAHAVVVVLVDAAVTVAASTEKMGRRAEGFILFLCLFDCLLVVFSAFSFSWLSY